MTVRVPFEFTGMVMWTLDDRETNGGRAVWQASYISLPVEEPESLEAHVQIRVRAGIERVRDDIPSLDVDQLQVQVDQSGDEPEVVAHGTVRFLASEWDAKKRQSAAGAR